MRYTHRTGDIFDIYMRDVRRTSRVNDSEAEALCVRAKTGDSESMRLLCEGYLPYGIFLAKRLRDKGIDFLDLVQITSVALCESISDFVPGRGKFRNFFAARAKAAMWQEIRERSKVIRCPRTTSIVIRALEKTDRNGRVSTLLASKIMPWLVLNGIAEHEALVRLNSAITRLEPRHRLVIESRMYGELLKDIADMLHVSRQTVRSIERAAIQEIGKSLGVIVPLGMSLCELGAIDIKHPNKQRIQNVCPECRKPIRPQSKYCSRCAQLVRIKNNAMLAERKRREAGDATD